jgi:hypothetical protein
MSKAHFDIRNYQHIVWKESSDLKQKLIDKIEAFIEDKITQIVIVKYSSIRSFGFLLEDNDLCLQDSKQQIVIGKI